MPAHRRLPHRTLNPPEALARGPAVLDAGGGDAVSFWTDVTRPALILGRSARDPELDRAALADAGLTVHQRASGGGAVLWDAGLLSLDVMLPSGHPLLTGDVVIAYRWIGEALRDGLRDVGVDADALTPDDARERPAPATPAARGACFGTYSPWEVVVAGRKVAGLCQIRRSTGGLLQVGIARSLDNRRLVAVLRGGADDERELAQRTAGVGDIAAETVTAAVDRRLADALGPAEDDEETAVESAAAADLAAGRFAAL